MGCRGTWVSFPQQWARGCVFASFFTKSVLVSIPCVSRLPRLFAELPAPRTSIRWPLIARIINILWRPRKKNRGILDIIPFFPLPFRPTSIFFCKLLTFAFVNNRVPYGATLYHPINKTFLERSPFLPILARSSTPPDFTKVISQERIRHVISGYITQRWLSEHLGSGTDVEASIFDAALWNWLSVHLSSMTPYH